MPFRREVLLDTDPVTAYDALREVVDPNLEEGPFEITVDEQDAEFGIAYMNAFSSSHYRFTIQEMEDGTRVEARLWLGGLVGPIHSLLRFWTHNRHLEQLLAGVERKATALAEEDAAADDAEAPDEPEPPETIPESIASDSSA